MSSSSTQQRFIALTGGIGSGKSLVGTFLKEQGIPVIDADDVVHHLLSENNVIRENIREVFGEAALDPGTGWPSRPRIGEIVFQDVEKRKLLESWLHPLVRQELAAFRKKHADAPVVVDIIPLLFESNLEARYPEVWLLASPQEDQVKRLQRYRHMTPEAALNRIQSQMPLDEKVKRLQIHPNGKLIHNSSSPSDLIILVADTLRSI